VPIHNSADSNNNFFLISNYWKVDNFRGHLNPLLLWAVCSRFGWSSPIWHTSSPRQTTPHHEDNSNIMKKSSTLNLIVASQTTFLPSFLKYDELTLLSRCDAWICHKQCKELDPNSETPRHPAISPQPSRPGGPRHQRHCCLMTICQISARSTSSSVWMPGFPVYSRCWPCWGDALISHWVATLSILGGQTAGPHPVDLLNSRSTTNSRSLPLTGWIGPPDLTTRLGCWEATYSWWCKQKLCLTAGLPISTSSFPSSSSSFSLPLHPLQLSILSFKLLPLYLYYYYYTTTTTLLSWAVFRLQLLRLCFTTLPLPHYLSSTTSQQLYLITTASSYTIITTTSTTSPHNTFISESLNNVTTSLLHNTALLQVFVLNMNIYLWSSSITSPTTLLQHQYFYKININTTTSTLQHQHYFINTTSSTLRPCARLEAWWGIIWASSLWCLFDCSSLTVLRLYLILLWRRF